MVATGNYVNVFNEKYDIFVILNEVNKNPDAGEVDDIETVVKENWSCLGDLCDSLDALNLECLKYGYQLCVKTNVWITESNRKEWSK